MKKLLKLIVSLAAIYALWLAYNAFDGSTRPNTRAASSSRSTAENSAYLDASRPLDSTDVAILVAKFNEADRAFARREVCLRARVTAAETPRRVFAPVGSIPGLITTELRSNYDATTTRPDASTSNSARTSPELRPNYDRTTTAESESPSNYDTTTTKKLQKLQKITTASRAENSLAAIYVRRSILEDELGKRETIATAFVITPDGNWTYYDPRAADALTPVIRDALEPLATVP